MEELSIEEKAKRYDEAIEIARAINSGKRIEGKSGDTVCECIFPELKESEDERIRKELLESFKYQQRESRTDKEWLNGIKLSKVVTWLEKQGEQKPAWSEEGENHVIGITQIIACAIKHNVVSQKTGEMEISWLKSFKPQSTEKPQGKTALEVWKDMRLEVYQQANGNRHEPNYSDDSTKMFSLTDIDEIFEKVVEKQSKQKSNPYSGVSFEYNGHTWGMCARDGGVDIGYDKQFIANINPIREKNEFDNLSKPIDSKEIGCNTGDFIMCTAPNHGI